MNGSARKWGSVKRVPEWLFGGYANGEAALR
jgi:hypothetical protein